MKRYYLALATAVILCISAFGACGHNDPETESLEVQPPAGQLGSVSEESGPDEPANDSSGESEEEWEDPYHEREAEYHKKDWGKAFGNPRYNFWVTIPEEWQAFDRSVNGDGYYIDCKNSNIDMRVYGSHYLPEIETIRTHLEGDSFLFDGGVNGFRRDELNKMWCSYLSGENSVITFYIDYSNDPQWFELNSQTVLSVAKSLRDGGRSISTEELLCDSFGVPAGSQDYYPQGTFSDFEIEWFGKQLLALEEPSMLQMASFSDGDLFACRFLYLRSFHEPIAIRAMIDQANNAGFIYYKVCDGAGGFDPGELITDRSIEISPEQCNSIISLLDVQEFWDMSLDEDRMGLDGSEWIIEAINGQSYHVVRRWSPESGGIYNIGKYMLELCGDEYDIY